MTTEELIQKIDALRLHMSVEQTPGVTYINVKSTLGNDICRVSSIDTSWFGVDFSPLGNVIMDEPTNVALSRAISKYLATPLDKRKPEKKYCLKAIRHYTGSVVETGYVKNVVCKSDYSGFEYSPVSFVFTEKELETMKKNDPVLAPAINAMKVEVKGDD